MNGGGSEQAGAGLQGYQCSPSLAALGTGSTAGWHSSPGSSSKAGGARWGMKSQCHPSACSSQLRFSKARLLHAPSTELERLRSPKYRLHSMGGLVGLCITLVNPSVQEAENDMGCSEISLPQDHQKLTPFLLCLLRVMS